MQIAICILSPFLVLVLSSLSLHFLSLQIAICTPDSFLSLRRNAIPGWAFSCERSLRRAPVTRARSNLPAWPVDGYSNRAPSPVLGFIGGVISYRIEGPQVGGNLSINTGQVPDSAHRVDSPSSLAGHLG